MGVEGEGETEEEEEEEDAEEEEVEVEESVDAEEESTSDTTLSVICGVAVIGFSHSNNLVRNAVSKNSTWSKLLT